MQPNYTRVTGAVAALAAAAGVVYALQPAAASTPALAQRNPAVEVRTVVIRRTIHIVRHQPLRHPAPGTPAGASAGAPGNRASTYPAPTTAVRTTASRHAGTAAPAATGSTGGSAPVTTSSSKHSTAGPASTGTGSPAPVTTRTSTHATSGGSTGGSGAVRTRTSGHTGGDDGGGDGGDD